MVTDSLRYWADTSASTASGSTWRRCTADRTAARSTRARRCSPRSPPTRCCRARKLIAEPWDATGEGYAVGGFGAELDRVERPVPGHHPRLLARRRRHPGPRVPAVRVVGPVRAGPPAVGVDQLRHRARRLHAARPGVLRPQAQRGQRRGQPGRHRPQPVLELRRRRARPTIRRSSRCAPGRPATSPPPCCCPPARRWSPWATSCGAPRAATTTPTARTTRSAGWTGTCSDGPTLEPRDMLAFFRRTLAIRSEAPALRQGEFFDGRAPGGGDGIPDLVWFNPWRPADDRRRLVRRLPAHPDDVGRRAGRPRAHHRRRAADGRLLAAGAARRRRADAR